MDLDDKLKSLHLSDNRRKRRRLSGIFKYNNEMNCENTESEDIVENETESKEIKPATRRSGRTKTTPVRWNSETYENNKSLTTTTKLDSNNLAAIEQYYLDKTIKKSTTSLETIFEEVKNTKTNIMSLRKLRRSINFSQNDKVNPGKIKKRKFKLKKHKKSMKKIELSLDDLYKKLASIDPE